MDSTRLNLRGISSVDTCIQRSVTPLKNLTEYNVLVRA